MSRDFNGLPARSLFSNDRQKQLVRSALIRLLRAEQITIEFGNRHPNPHVKAFKPPPISVQIDELEKSDLQKACVYPSESILSQKAKASDAQRRPFTRRLMLGEPQLEFC